MTEAVAIVFSKPSLAAQLLHANASLLPLGIVSNESVDARVLAGGSRTHNFREYTNVRIDWCVAHGRAKVRLEDFMADGCIDTIGENGILLMPWVKVKQKTTPYPQCGTASADETRLFFTSQTQVNILKLLLTTFLGWQCDFLLAGSPRRHLTGSSDGNAGSA
jgi:hypothetical protein